MKNKLSDVHNHLMAQLERLSDEALDAEKLQLELDRTKAIAVVSSQIVANARVVLDAKIAAAEYGIAANPLAALTGPD